MRLNAREIGPREERDEDGGRAADGEAQGVGDYVDAAPAEARERDVAPQEVVYVHAGRGVFEDVVQASAREREGF